MLEVGDSSLPNKDLNSYFVTLEVENYSQKVGNVDNNKAFSRKVKNKHLRNFFGLPVWVI
jgi:hypothetical protein